MPVCCLSGCLLAAVLLAESDVVACSSCGQTASSLSACFLFAAYCLLRAACCLLTSGANCSARQAALRHASKQVRGPYLPEGRGRHWSRHNRRRHWRHRRHCCWRGRERGWRAGHCGLRLGLLGRQAKLRLGWQAQVQLRLGRNAWLALVQAGQQGIHLRRRRVSAELSNTCSASWLGLLGSLDLDGSLKFSSGFGDAWLALVQAA